MSIKGDMNKIPSLLSKALNFQSRMKSVLGNIQEIIVPYIDLTDYDGDKEDFLHNLSIVETTDGFCFVADLDDAITSVCFLADERVWDRKNYPDYEDWLFKNGHCLAILTSMPSQTKFDEELYKEWVEFIGGEKNVYLREIIKGKRLSM